MVGAAMLAVLATTPALATPNVGRSYSKTYNDCMDAAAGSTMPTRDCIGAEYQAWDKQLNDTYQALIAGRAAPDKVKLRDDERAWLKDTKTRCDHAGDDERGGSLQGIEIDQCNLDQRILRTVYLRGLR
jgi:uncharacterized protein YecT (DUF1311 family)